MINEDLQITLKEGILSRAIALLQNEYSFHVKEYLVVRIKWINKNLHVLVGPNRMCLSARSQRKSDVYFCTTDIKER